MTIAGGSVKGVISLGERELDVMAVLWRAGSGTVSEVRDAVRATLAYTTVLTILRNLEAKGAVIHAVEGKSHRYVPLLKEQDARKSAVDRIIQKFFRGSAERLVLHLIRDGELSRKDLKKIRRAARSPGKANEPELKSGKPETSDLPAGGTTAPDRVIE
ncbi:MAG: BlaI/MecI/CopY family transcriptional regulator [Gemmatimonadaceae bacterium]